MARSQPKVGIVVGSESDRETMSAAGEILDRLGVPWELVVSSAHRAPESTRSYAAGARGRGIRVLIAGAGLSAALPGVLASHTELPVIGVPLAASTLGGLDSLLSISQMPAGIPVAAVAVGRPGARNAALLAARILALSDPAVEKAVTEHRRSLGE
jgi:phosphoribosylamine--glycine ligase